MASQQVEKEFAGIKLPPLDKNSFGAKMASGELYEDDEEEEEPSSELTIKKYNTQTRVKIRLTKEHYAIFSKKSEKVGIPLEQYLQIILADFIITDKNLGVKKD